MLNRQETILPSASRSSLAHRYSPASGHRRQADSAFRPTGELSDRISVIVQREQREPLKNFTTGLTKAQSQTYVRKLKIKELSLECAGGRRSSDYTRRLP